jgi:hypothetical protein
MLHEACSGFRYHRGRSGSRDQRWIYIPAFQKCWKPEALTGINDNNANCVVYDFCSEVLFGVTMSGKTIAIMWLDILLTHIVACDIPGHTVRRDLGGETGKNPEI